jgi:molecular chaperone DnaK
MVRLGQQWLPWEQGMAKTRAVGIDLGTTYSAMAWVNETGHSALVPTDEGDLLTPSVVLFDDEGIVVGKEAKKVAILYPDRVAACVKRDMGKPVYTKPIGQQYLPPEVIQSYILKKLNTALTRVTGPDHAVVITVPAYFDEPRRKATWQAGELAGLRVLDIVNEPTAAALAFGEDLGYLSRDGAVREPMNVMVYDLGGGTFDVTLIDLQTGKVRTIATDGEVELGGHDWDMRMVDFLAGMFEREHGEDPRTSPFTLQRMLAEAEESKHTLSARSRTIIHLTHNDKTSHIVLSRDLFEQQTADLLERTRYTTRQLLATAGMQWKDIGRVLLTGGSTRMPMVGRMIKELTGIDPDKSVNPDEAVARGAALYAQYLLTKQGGQQQPSFDVTNVNAHSLGVEAVDPATGRKRNRVLIGRNTPLPARRTEEFATKAANQRTVVVQVLEGESLEPSQCSMIGRTVIRDLPPNLPQGSPVQVTFEYGANGRLTVTAKMVWTNQEVQLELERAASMSLDRMQAWKQVVQSGNALSSFEEIVEAELVGLQKEAAGAGLVLKPIPIPAARADGKAAGKPTSSGKGN